MICVLPFWSGDVKLTHELLVWMGQLGGCAGHDMVLVADAAVNYVDALEIKELAEQSFKSVTLLTNGKSVVGWPLGPNSLWLTAARWAKENQVLRWLWLETDAIPLKPGWLDAIENEAKALPEPLSFMGAKISGEFRGNQKTYLNGVAVYPPYAIDIMQPSSDSSVAFDLWNVDGVLANASNSTLFHCMWGEKDNPPTFSENNIPGTRTFSLRQINANAVLFHRNKDGTLIRLLRRKFNLHVNEPFIVALPFCNVDGPQAIKNLQWIHEMGGCPNTAALLSYEAGTIGQWTAAMESYARASFGQVHILCYPKPPRWGWPYAPNHAFQCTARHISKFIRQPWLWLEADCVPLKAGWWDTLQAEYMRCGKPVMGPVVKDYGHVNGTAIYPADFAERSPKAMACTDTAFDWAMKPDTAPITHDASHLMCMVWGIENGVAMPHSGNAASFRTQADVDRWVCPGAVLFHRAKDGTLIDRLKERRK